MHTIGQIIHRTVVTLARRRAQRIALREQMFLRPAWLDDLGIDEIAVRDALEQSRRASSQDQHSSGSDCRLAPLNLREPA